MQEDSVLLIIRKILNSYLKNGEELVMFTDENDMLNKIDYYMCHEKERMEIAVNGHRAVKKFDLHLCIEAYIRC